MAFRALIRVPKNNSSLKLLIIDLIKIELTIIDFKNHKRINTDYDYETEIEEDLTVDQSDY